MSVRKYVLTVAVAAAFAFSVGMGAGRSTRTAMAPHATTVNEKATSAEPARCVRP